MFTPSDVFFADTSVGTKAQYTYTYNPNATVTPKISGPQASEFSATAPVCTQGFYPTTPPTCRFSITFNPNAAGLRSAKLALDTSGNYLPLAGMATTESSTGLSFEDPYLPYYPLPQPILLVNKGTSSVTLTSIGFQTITGPVEFTETNNCGATLAPNASCTITVLTTRLAEGGTQALLTATTDTTSSTLVLDNSLYPVINLGAIADDNTGNAAYPVPGPFTYVDYSGLFAASYIQNPQVFSFTSCPVGTGTCAGEVGYKPTQIGMQVGTLVLFGPGPSYFSAGTNEAVQQYVVVGTGVTTEPGAKLLLSQNGFATFPGTTAVNTSTLTLINPGSHTLELTGPMLSGSTPQNFALGQASCLRGSSTTKNMASVPPGMQCTIPITFNSKQTGFSTATATVTDSISGLSFSTPLYVATLVGPSLAPSSLSFPSTVVNTVSAPQSITVTRDLTHPITTSSSGGIIATKGACAAGEDPCTLSFVYAPTSTADSPIVSVQDVALGSSTALPVTATALRAVVHSSVLASPGYLTFPSQTVGTVSATQTITLTSEGPGVLNLYSFGFADGSAGQFTQSNNCSAMLAVNASCTVVVSFAPTSAGNKYDAIVVNASSNTGLPLSLPLSGVAR